MRFVDLFGIGVVALAVMGLAVALLRWWLLTFKEGEAQSARAEVGAGIGAAVEVICKGCGLKLHDSCPT